MKTNKSAITAHNISLTIILDILSLDYSGKSHYGILLLQKGRRAANSYVISVICPAGTPVPEGLVYRDLPASYVAKGRYGDGLNDVINTFTSKGFLTCYIDLPWNAELYLDDEENNPPIKDCHQPFRWLVPCVKVDEV